MTTYEKPSVQPITISKSVWFFLISSLLIYFGLYVGIPILLDGGIPFAIGYFIFLYSPHVLLLCTALVLYKKESHSWSVAAFKQRMRLYPLKKSDGLWIMGVFLVYIILMMAGTPLMSKIAQIPLFSPPDFFPAEINPNKTAIPGYMMDYRVSGQYWVIAVYFIGWAFNILGEEFLWRGILFPRQIAQYGAKAWIFHGLLWGLWHFYWKWELIMLIPFALLLSYAVYKSENTWVGIIAHGALNFIPFIMVTIAVFGS